MKKQDITTATPMLTLAATAALALAACGSSTTAETKTANESSATTTATAAAQTTATAEATQAEETQQTEATTDATAENAEVTQASEEQATSAQAGDQATDSGAATTTEAAGSPGQPIENPCEGVCREIETINVEHPNLGPVQIVTYEDKDLMPGSAPGFKLLGYALMKDGVTLGWAEAKDGAITLGSRPSLGGGPEAWDVPDGVNTDKYGNVYLSTGGPDGVVILTPTENGYDSKGTLPGGGDDRFANAEIHIDESGEPTLIVDLRDQPKKTYTYNGTEFVES